MSAWYKRYPADFLHGTSMLSCEEKGAYSVALDLMYERGGPIPDDAAWIARMCGCSVRKWTQTLRPALIAAGKLNVRADGKLSNGRMEYETHRMVECRAKASAAGQRGAQRKATDIDAINRGELCQFNAVASAMPVATDSEPATGLSPVYRPDKPAIIDTKHSENRGLGLAYSDTQKEKEERKSPVSSNSSTNQPLNLTQTVRAPKTLRASVGPFTQEWQTAFETFYAAYPRKKAPDRARAAFFKRLREGIDPAAIIAGLARCVFDDRPQYRPHPATWLNDGRWADEPDDTFDPAMAAAGLTPEMIARESVHAPSPAPPPQLHLLLAAVGGRGA